jgi:hypothetical protein
MEYLFEGWVKFVRIKCKKGCIDKWTGDCINDPNNETKNNLNLNSMDWYYRLNGTGKWINKREFKEDLQVWALNLCDTESAIDIWNALKKETIIEL